LLVYIYIHIVLSAIYPCESRERKIDREMGFVGALMIIIASMIVCCSSALDESGVIYVGGKVQCQDCTKGWNEWVNGGNPMKGIVALPL